MDNENKWEYDYSSQNKPESGDTGYPNVGSSGMNTANQYNDPQPEPENSAPQSDGGAGGTTPPEHPVQQAEPEKPKKKKKVNGKRIARSAVALVLSAAMGFAGGFVGAQVGGRGKVVIQQVAPSSVSSSGSSDSSITSASASGSALSTEQVADLVQFSRTTQSYRNLMAGAADLLLAAEPAPEVAQELKQEGEWLLTPFATDALVFVVNEDNPVDSLTTEQVRKIYTGQITNWKEVGGDDATIVVLNRKAGSGTRATFEAAVFGDEAVDFKGDAELDKSGDVQTQMGSTDNAISYLDFSHFDDSKFNAIKVEGVEPKSKNVTDDSFKIWATEHMYCSKDADEATKAFLEFMLSDDVQGKLVEEQGFIPVSAMKVVKDASGKVSAK